MLYIRFLFIRHNTQKTWIWWNIIQCVVYVYLLWLCTYKSIKQHEPVSQERLNVLCHVHASAVLKSTAYWLVVFQCNLPFSLEVQWVCGASVCVALSCLLWAQQRPAVVLHDTTDFQLKPLNSHHLTGRKYDRNVIRDSHRATIKHYLCSTVVHGNPMYLILRF